jgi:hypothetical protein
MRLRSILSILVALASLGFAAPDQASAFGYERHRPDGWGHARTVRHWVYKPRYNHVYYVDPYAYQYSPRGYYPYYGSKYWVPSQVMRERKYAHYHNWNVQPPRYRYYRSWGYPKKHWKHKAWHRKHHGYHHRWHY